MTRGDRRDQDKRWAERRWLRASSWHLQRVQGIVRVSNRQGWDEPSYAFCLTDMRLTILFWWMRTLYLARQRRWVTESHNCSCFYCRQHTRRFQGNSRAGWSHQELRLRTGENLSGFLDDDRDEANAIYFEQINALDWRPELDESLAALSPKENGGGE